MNFEKEALVMKECRMKFKFSHKKASLNPLEELTYLCGRTSLKIHAQKRINAEEKAFVK